MHEEVITRDMVPTFVKLLKDPEAEVRTDIASQIPGRVASSIFGYMQENPLTEWKLGFCSLIDRDTLLNEIMTSIEDLVSDPSQHVRAALGTQISGLAPILGKEE